MRIPKGHDVNNDNKMMKKQILGHASLGTVTLFIIDSLDRGERHCHSTFLGGRPCDFVNSCAFRRVSSSPKLASCFLLTSTAAQSLSPQVEINHRQNVSHRTSHQNVRGGHQTLSLPHSGNLPASASEKGRVINEQ
jgi:hypothetical protein